MVGSQDTDAPDDPNGDQKPPLEVSSVSCSICLEFVVDDGTRSIAKLQCGHKFHLDCIGSAFNKKGAMQCPNCRKVEKGRWLYASGNASGSPFSFPEFNINDWSANEDPHGLIYTEMPSRVHWCPFSGSVRVQSSFEGVESPQPPYPNLHRHHAAVSDQQVAASAMAHSYVAYFGPGPPPITSNTSENVEDPNFNHPWNGLSGHNEITAHAFPIIGVRHQNRGHHSHPFSGNSGHVIGADQASIPPANLRPTRGNYDPLTRSVSVVHPFLHGPRNTHSHPSMSISHPTNHPRNSPLVPGGVRRFNVPRGLPPTVPAVSRSDHSGGFFLSPPTGSSGRNPHEPGSSLPNHFHTGERDRDRGQVLFNHASGGSDSSNRSGRVRHGR